MRRDGVVLVEVLIALVILAAAGVSTISYVATLMLDRDRIEQREEELYAAESTLMLHAVLTAPELVQRIGARVVGSHLVTVERPQAELFRIAVSLLEAPDTELVVTVVFRPEVTDAS